MMEFDMESDAVDSLNKRSRALQKSTAARVDGNRPLPSTDEAESAHGKRPETFDFYGHGEEFEAAGGKQL